MKQYKRVFVIVIDSLGIGAADDAEQYGDSGADTLGSIARENAGLCLENLQKLGLANLHTMQGVSAVEVPLGKLSVLRERSVGKDTMTGHWEMMGLCITAPFKTFTDTGFPPELIDVLQRETGRKIIGNKSASGTEILDELAMREIEHGELIVYTSADSVLQICGHEEHMGLDTLYRYCKVAREFTMQEQWRVGRVIARPYVGDRPGAFVRTSNRHDYALKPFGKTALDALSQGGVRVYAIGKIRDIFDGEGITDHEASKSSVHGMEQTIALAQSNFEGFCFVNLVDFDAKWGHRRDAKGYGAELEVFDKKLGTLLAVLKEDDLLILTADHGNDPCFAGSDHTRENVPFIAYSPSMQAGGILPQQDTFAVVGASIAHNFGVSMPKDCIGHSILDIL